MTRTTILSATLLVGLALTCCLAKDAAQPQQQSSLASKLVPQTKARSARSLSDMFEKMKSKIFGSRKQQASAQSSAAITSQVQPAASINAAQRQPWTDLNSFNQQYNPYLVGQYQWPSSSASNQFAMSQPYGPLNGLSSASSSGYPTQPGQSGSIIPGMDTSQQSGLSMIGQSSLTPAANSNVGQTSQANGASGSGLLSSASHLISQYLSPSSSSSSSSSSAVGLQSQSPSGGQQQQIGSSQPNGQTQSALTSQQQQQQSQYQEFASILDSMVAQTGANVPSRQPNMNQYMNMPQGQQGGMQPQQQGFQSPPNGLSGSLVGDNDMSGSSNIQNYMPTATQQQASQKSSMVGLAEQLAPGSQFNKLVSFPFSLTSNDDPSKEGRYKLHIPFLNQHVKRSDQQQQAGASGGLAAQQRAQQQQIQQYLNSYYNQQQLYAASSMANPAAQHPSQQLSAQPSQVMPTIISPQSQSSSSSSSSSSSAIPQSQPPTGAAIQSLPSSQSAGPSPSQSQSSASSSSSSISSQSSSSLLPSQSNPSSSSSASAGQVNSRPSWSVADIQSSSSSSKLIPIQSAASSSSVESISQN